MSTQVTEMEFGNKELRVTWEFEAGDPGVHTFPNGDPGYPPTGPEWYWEKVELKLEPGEWLDVSKMMKELLGDDGEDRISLRLDKIVADCPEEDDEPPDRYDELRDEEMGP